MIEGLSLATVEYHLDDRVAVDRQEALLKALCALDGVENAEISNNAVSVQFYPDMLSRESVRRELDRLGVRSTNARRPGNPFKRFVDRIAESNAKNFGTEPLDCCKLNRNASPGA